MVSLNGSAVSALYVLAWMPDFRVENGSANGSGGVGEEGEVTLVWRFGFGPSTVVVPDSVSGTSASKLGRK